MLFLTMEKLLLMEKIMKKKLITLSILYGIMASSGLNAAPPETISIAEARNIIHGKATLPDPHTHWVLDKTKQGSGWQFDAHKALAVLDRKGVHVTRGGMYHEGDHLVHYLITSDFNGQTQEHAMYEMLFKKGSK